MLQWIWNEPRVSSIVAEYISTLPEYKRKLLATREGRIAVCRTDFRLFTYIYFRNTMKSPDTGNEVTLSGFHEAFIGDALKYMLPMGPAESRTAWVCPRGSGKSTWGMMLIIWLGAYYPGGPFISLFSATSTQSEDLLQNIRSQFNQNDLLRQDFPDLVRPATKKSEAIKLSDNKQLIMQANGFICTGRGVTTSVLGMRIDGKRPTHIYADDVEAGESQTTSTDVSKLLTTIQDDIMPLSLNAHFIWVGTTTRPGGLTEQLVHASLGMDHAAWVDDENFRVNYWPALREDENGEKRSIWEPRWTTEFLKSIEHTRSFAKNYQCLPAADDYMYWSPEVFVYKEAPELDYVMLSVDPSVTITERSDYTGLAVVGYSKALKKTYVLHCEEVKLSGADLRKRASEILTMYPAIALIYCETNQGGDLVRDIFKTLPVKVKTVHQSIPKNVRAATALAEYEKGNVIHTRRLPSLESQMLAFPTKGIHDDMVDATGTAVLYFAKVNGGGTAMKAQNLSYG